MTVVDFETTGDVARIALDRPDKLNAIDGEVLHGLLDAVDALGRDDALGAAVLSGRGRAFSAGGDIKAMHGMDDQEFAATISLYMRVSAAFRACPKPIVAAIHGLRPGGWLRTRPDVRRALRRKGRAIRAAGHATRSQPDERYDLAAAAGRRPRPGHVPHVDAESIDADEAERIGFVDRVTEPEALLSEAEAFAHRIASYPRVGVAWTKLGFHRALGSSFEEAMLSEEEAELACFRSPETRERFAGIPRPRTRVAQRPLASMCSRRAERHATSMTFGHRRNSRRTRQLVGSM